MARSLLARGSTRAARRLGGVSFRTMNNERDPADHTAEEKRLAARRRFLRGGAGGAALVVTIVHKRAFAMTSSTLKKGAIASQCTSLMGVADMTGLDQKKAIQLSQFGNAPKNMVCRERPAINTCGTEMNKSQYRDASGNFVNYLDPKQFKNGCGELDVTLEKSYNYRLYEKGWCPVTYDNGQLGYDASALYYNYPKGSNILQAFRCLLPPS